MGFSCSINLLALGIRGIPLAPHLLVLALGKHLSLIVIPAARPLSRILKAPSERNKKKEQQKDEKEKDGTG